jgi:DNA polymerase IIIc chi subunit
METTGINDSERSAARERYRFYQERGYALNTHKIDSRRG